MIEYLPLVLTGIGIIVSILYYSNVLRNANKARQRELIIQRTHTYSTEYTKTWVDVKNMSDWETPEEFVQKYGIVNNPVAMSKWLYIMRIFSLAGLHLQEGVDPDLLFQLYPIGAIIGLWEQFEPIILYQRERENSQNSHKTFEQLYREAKKREPQLNAQAWSTTK
jgi:hypothetical protein